MITTLPNRYSSFNSEAKALEEKNGLTIHRIKLPVHHSGMVDQAKSFAFFASGVLKIVRRKQYDLVVATSSRLMTAFLGSFVSRWKRTPLYLDIRDIFVDTMNNVLKSRLARLVTPFLSLIEKFTITRAEKVNLVSKGFEDYFRSRYPGIEYSFYTNGVDDEFIKYSKEDAWSDLRCEPNKPVKIVYAGNIGEGQGLQQIVPQLALKLKDKAKFSIIGDGGRRPQLEQKIVETGCANVELLPPVKRDALMKAYQEADVLFLHLNDYDAFKKVLPSKLFEYAAMSKPILAGIGGYSAEFARAEISNVAIFKPCDADDGQKAFEKLELKLTFRPVFVNKYARVNIMKQMAIDIAGLLNKGK